MRSVSESAKPEGRAGDGEARDRLGIGVEDRGGDAAHPFGAFLIVDGKAALADAGEVAQQGGVRW